MPGHDLQIAVETPEAARSLHRWLSQDGPLRGRIRLRWAGGEQPADPEADADTLGDVTDVIGIALASALALPAFVDSMHRWFAATRPPGAGPIVLRRGGTTLELPPDADPATIAAVVEALDTAPLREADDTDA
jgi:hypothetical protein